MRATCGRTTTETCLPSMFACRPDSWRGRAPLFRGLHKESGVRFTLKAMSGARQADETAVLNQLANIIGPELVQGSALRSTIEAALAQVGRDSDSSFRAMVDET